MSTDTAQRPTYSRPGWTRAHYLVEYGSLGAIQLYITACERGYPMDDPEVDEPTPAPKGMPLCSACAKTAVTR